MSELAAADAAMHYRARYASTDQFLVYAFPHVGSGRVGSGRVGSGRVGSGRVGSGGRPATLRERAAAVGDLGVGIAAVAADLGGPRWVRSVPGDDRFRIHEASTWAECLTMLGELIVDNDRDESVPWRLHLFGPLDGVPEVDGPARIVVLQIAHALGDGRRVSAIARALLGPDDPAGPAPQPGPGGRLADAGAAVWGALRIGPRMVAATAWGVAAWRRAARPDPEPAPGPAPGPIRRTVLNGSGDGAGPVRLRTLHLSADALREHGPSVTTAVLAVLAEVLPTFGGAADDGRVLAEVTVARPAEGRQRNNFHTVGVDLRADVDDRRERAATIRDELAAARRRDGTAARRTARRAEARTPPVLAAAAARLAAQAPAPSTVSGATVVSSVDRGPADLTLEGAPVAFTAGFPALSSAHDLTHGVHGIGDVVTVSVCARGAAASVVDDYVHALALALAFAQPRRRVRATPPPPRG
ncbi:WS/DGAT domain-containing protein [Gordonia shandongensis]|uniref:WS/DGAT domain-containing protein n=1 Tax=Gordonia shandongensis TaxID=376351 RepID=UPI0003FD6486|nr:WS/DGAT domain-containing protein [Gordonia shandongensis]